MKNPKSLLAYPYLFLQQVAKTPNNLAIVFEEEEYTYKELNQLADKFQLAAANSKGCCIGICIDKSPQAIAAMLGILKAGAVFVPLDPEYPADRIAYMIQDADIKTIFAQPKHQQIIEPQIESINSSSDGNTIKWIDCYNPVSEAAEYSCQSIEIKENDLAYIMYTSGSTGQPKGVQIEHKALATYCYADIDVYKVCESDRTLQFSTINFDIAIEEIFPPLLIGGSIVIRPSERTDSLIELSSIINKYQVTAVHIATAYWHEWVDLMVAANGLIPKSLRLMVVTGEKVSTKHYQHWKTLCEKSNKKDVLWCNAYGPTEATVSASVFIPDNDFNADNMPIGKPLKGYTAMIVDDEYNNLSIGETGQLLIGGPALARGYLNRPELTDEVFINVSSNGEAQRMYKTGDLARWLPNGDIEFAGRIDHQIKLGSYRIEPGEIEVAINKHELVLESLVSYDEVDGKKSLIAYIAQGENTIKIDDLSSFLKQSLPVYMIPTRFVLVSDFPKTSNGKIDRKALPSPESSQIASSSSYIAPRNPLEKKLATMWEEVLRVPKAGIHDDFFALGGSSLLAVGVVSRLITELKLELPVRDFFANPTIASQAKHIHEMLKAENIKSDIKYDNANSEDDSQTLRDRLPIVKPDFFISDNHKLFGIHYKPPVISARKSRRHAVLMCHPIGHEYARSYRNLQQLAILLAQAGFDVFRFDYHGTGNSEGSSEQMTAEQCSKDIRGASEFIRKQSQCDELSVLAVRLGVPLAIQAQLENIENFIAWDPVVHGNTFIDLLKFFHHRAITGIKRYRKIRKDAKSNQLYGHAYNEQKRVSFEKLLLNPDYQKATTKNVNLVTSKDYTDNEKGLIQQISDWNYYPTEDDIHWHHIDYSESAFSSPQVFKVIMQILSNEAD